MKDLREFITKVDELGELKVIEGADWNLEIGGINHVAAMEPNPPALLFDKIKDYKAGYRILTIPYTTDRRTALALRLSTEATRLELVRLLRDKLHEPMEPVPPVEVKDGPILQNVYTGDEVDLFMFPTPQWFALDAGRYIGTGDTVIVRDPVEGWINVGTHRIQIQDKSTATIFMDIGKHAEKICRKYWEQGKGCPVAVTCGGDPLHIAIGGSRIPWGVSEYDYIGWWQKEPLEVIKGPTTGLPIPAHSEIALEGEIVPPEVDSRDEGPFSEWTGHYTPKKKQPAFRVKCILHRSERGMVTCRVWWEWYYSYIFEAGVWRACQAGGTGGASTPGLQSEVYNSG